LLEIHDNSVHHNKNSGKNKKSKPENRGVNLFEVPVLDPHEIIANPRPGAKHTQCKTTLIRTSIAKVKNSCLIDYYEMLTPSPRHHPQIYRFAKIPK